MLPHKVSWCFILHSWTLDVLVVVRSGFVSDRLNVVLFFVFFAHHSLHKPSTSLAGFKNSLYHDVLQSSDFIRIPVVERLATQNSKPQRERESKDEEQKVRWHHEKLHDDVTKPIITSSRTPTEQSVTEILWSSCWKKSTDIKFWPSTVMTGSNIIHFYHPIIVADTTTATATTHIER